MATNKSKVGANSQASQAGAQTGVGQTDAAAGHRSSGAETTSDIGQAESYTINLKKLTADELDHATNLRDAATRRIRNAEDHDQQLRNLAMQSIQNAVNLQNRVNTLSVDHDSRVRAFQEGEVSRTVRHSDLAIDRQWNIDEVAALIAKNPIFQDAIAGTVAAAVAAAMKTK